MKLSELYPTEAERSTLYRAFDPHVPAPDGTFFGKWWFNFFADRETITDNQDTFFRYVRQIHPIIMRKWAILIGSYPDLLSGLVEDRDVTTVKMYAAPNGRVDEAYTTGATTETREESTTEEDMARLTRMNEIRNVYFDLLDEYKTLFVEVWAL